MEWTLPNLSRIDAVSPRIGLWLVAAQRLCGLAARRRPAVEARLGRTGGFLAQPRAQ